VLSYMKRGLSLFRENPRFMVQIRLHAHAGIYKQWFSVAWYNGRMDNITAQNTGSVKDYLASLDEQTVKESQVLIEIMQRISGHEPKLWNVGTIGFDTYHYTYDSGREGDGHVLGFYPRKGKITVYLMDGTARYAELLAQLGKHTTTGYCVYIKRLSDVELPILEHIVQQSYEYIQSKSKDGPIDRVLWQTEK
jgi:Domain of unknown function (DU1801)